MKGILESGWIGCCRTNVQAIEPNGWIRIQTQPSRCHCNTCERQSEDWRRSSKSYHSIYLKYRNIAYKSARSTVSCLMSLLFAQTSTLVSQWAVRFIDGTHQDKIGKTWNSRIDLLHIQHRFIRRYPSIIKRDRGNLQQSWYFMATSEISYARAL